MKIIDADKLHYKQVYIQTEKGLRPALVVFAKEIRKMPEMVLCKDCKWWTKQSDSPQGRCELFHHYPTGGWYCANGRRENETD